MPELSRFYGIIIYMYWNDEFPPHFHARYGDEEAKILIKTLAVHKGKLPPKALSLVVEWASQHQKELESNWKNAKSMKPIKKIKPL